MIQTWFITLLVVALVAGIALVHFLAARHRLVHVIVALAYWIPALGCGVLVWFFVVNQGRSVVQAAVGDERLYELWSSWVGLWFALLVAQSASLAGNVIWLLASLTRARRRWLPVPSVGALLSVLALFVVLAHAPRA